MFAIHRTAQSAIVILAFLTTFHSSAHGQSVWTDTAGDDLWSSFTNWSTGISPAATDVTFNATGFAAAAGTVTSIVDQNFAINSLSFTQSLSTQFHTLQINSGSTLTVNGAGGFKLGIANTTNVQTNVTITGGGALVVNNTAANFEVGLPTGPASGATPGNNATLNLAGLASFTANVNEFRAGYGSVNGSTLTLSNTANSITANTIQIANSAAANGSNATVTLGTGTNVIQATTINIGASKVTGTLKFASQTSGSPGTVTISGKSGGAANIVVGSTLGTGTAGTPIGILDLRGHVATVTAGTLMIGQRDGTLAGGATGTVSFDAGTFTVNNLSLAVKTNAGTGAATGTLNIGGGTFTVNSGGSFTLASQATAGTASGTVNLTGGTLVSNVDIKDGGGAATTTLNVTGGTLDMTGHNIGSATSLIDALNFQSGTLKNLGEINNGAGLSTTGTGTLILEGSNAYTGGTSIASGTTLQVGSGGTTGNLGSGTINNLGILAINHSDLVTITNTFTGTGNNSTLGIRQIGTGRTVITADNSGYSNARVIVSAGTLSAANANALGTAASLEVQSAGTFNFRTDTASATLTVRDLSLANGSSLGAQLGNTLAVAPVASVGGAATASGSVTIKLIGNPAIPSPSGTYNLVTAQNGGLSGASYTLNTFNQTNFTVNSFTPTDGVISVNVSSASELAAAYWAGGRVASPNGGVWAVSNGTTSNWASDAAGTVTGQVPGASTDVIFSITSGASNQTSTSLGADMSIKSLTVNDTAGLGLSDASFALNIVGSGGIHTGSTAGAVTLNTAVNLTDAAPAITVDGSNGLTIAGVLGGNGFTKSGVGTLQLSGSAANTYTGTTTVNQGELDLNKTSAIAVTGNLVIGDGTGVDSVKLLAADQIADTSDVTLNSSGVLDLHGFADSVDALTGNGVVTNSAASAGTLTVGAGNEASFTFSGTIQNGTGTAALSKTGTGTMILTGSYTATGAISVLNGTFRLGGSNLIATAPVTVDGATSIFDLGSGHTDTVGTVTLLNGGAISGTGGSALSSTSAFDLRAGTVTAILAGSTGINKTTTGTVNLSGANTFTGDVLVTEGIVNLQSGGSIGVASATAPSLRVGDGANATFTAQAGSSLQVGHGSSSFLQVGVRSTATTLGASTSTLDLTALSSFTANVGNLYLGVNIGNGSGGNTSGTLKLATNNTITASTQILLGSSGNNGNSVTSTLTLGSGINNFTTPLITVGGQKSFGVINTAAGSTWNLANGAGTTDLYVGRNNTGTGTVGSGLVDLTGGTIIARLGLLSIGDKDDGFGTSGGVDGTFTSGASDLNNIQVSQVKIGSLSGGTTTAAKGNGTLNWNGGFLTAGSIALGKLTGTGTSIGILNVNGGTVTVNSNLTDGGGTTALNLNGGTLDLTGHSIGTAASHIDTVTFQSGVLRNVSEINGGAGLTKTGTGTLTLAGTNTHTGATTVSAGTLWVASANGMGASTTVSVASGAGFDYAPGAGEVLNLTALTLSGGSRIGAELKNGSVVVSNPATTSGSIAVDVIGIPGVTYTTGRYNIVTAPSGLDGATYTLGNIYNPTNFTVSSVGGDATSIFVNLASATELTTAYWKGGLSGATNVWAASNGTTQSNWTTDAAGTLATPLVPGSSTQVIFSATGATGVSNTTLGSNMSIGSLTFDDPTAAIAVNDPSHTLAINSANALTTTSNSGAVTLHTQINLNNASPVIAVNNSGGLELDGAIGGNGFTKTGTGTLTLSGSTSSTFTGTTTLTEGTLILNKSAGVTAISSNFIIGDGTGTDIVKLLNSEQIADTSAVTLNAGAVLDLNGNSETIASLTGTGKVTSSNSVGISTLTLAPSSGSSSFQGLIEDGAGQIALTKNGAGTVTLNGTTANTFTGATTVNRGLLVLNAPGGAASGSTSINIISTASGTSQLRLDADNQFASTAAVNINASGGQNAQLNLNGHTQTIGSLVITTTTNGGAALNTGSGGTVVVNGNITLNNDRSATGNSARHLLITGTGTTSTAAPNSGTLDLGGAVRTITVQTAFSSPDSDALIETSIVNGGIIKAGARQLYLTGTNTYSGGTTVNAGAIVANNAAGSATGTGNVTVNTGATLAGNGTVGLNTGTQNITIQSGATLSIGNSGDVLATSDKALALGSGGLGTISLGGTLAFDIFANASGANPTTNNDLLQLNVGTSGSPGHSVVLGGTLQVTDTTGNSLSWVQGDAWQLIDWANVFTGANPTNTGTFSTFNLPALNTGLTWDTTQIYTTGFIAVAPEPGRVLLLLIGLSALGLRRRRR